METWYVIVAWHDYLGAARDSRPFNDADAAMSYGERLTEEDFIPMLVEVKVDFCKHCAYAIQEKPGWVMHRWIHIATGAYTCLNKELTQAEPENDE